MKIYTCKSYFAVNKLQRKISNHQSFAPFHYPVILKFFTRIISSPCCKISGRCVGFHYNILDLFKFQNKSSSNSYMNVLDWSMYRCLQLGIENVSYLHSVLFYAIVCCYLTTRYSSAIFFKIGFNIQRDVHYVRLQQLIRMLLTLRLQRYCIRHLWSRSPVCQSGIHHKYQDNTCFIIPPALIIQKLIKRI